MLTLPIKKKWFDYILSGEKKQEYREFNSYWRSRLENYFNVSAEDLVKYRMVSQVQDVLLRNGYRKDAPHAIIRASLSVGKGEPFWGAEPGIIYFCLNIEDAYPVDPEKSIGVWEIVNEPIFTPGGDPTYECPTCKSRHVFGLENNSMRHSCKTCKSFMIYPWQCKTH